MAEEHRLNVLDGLRAFAILLVIGFHYFSRWTQPLSAINYYPYGTLGAKIWIFQYGYVGVDLFFIISGFVISMTLFRCRGFADFAWKRFSRLFPTMLLCSTLTYISVLLLPHRIFHPNLRDFLPSLTFTEPLLWTKVFGEHFQAIDGAYWSLFAEVKFYFWIGVLYFSLGPRRFFQSTAVFFGIIISLSALTRVMDARHAWIADFIFAADSLPWFVAGIGFFSLYRDGANRFGWILLSEALIGVAIINRFSPDGTFISLFAAATFFALFFAMLIRPEWIKWLGSPKFTSIGVSSYSLYLLHQHIGVGLLAQFRSNWGLSHPFISTSISIILAIFLICISEIIYKFWELPAKNFLHGLWKKRVLL